MPTVLSPSSSSGSTATDSPVLDSKFDDFGTAATPAIIPPSHPARTLVLCFDGTGDQFDSDNSNVVQFLTMLKKDDRHQQMVYYQAGIGTYTAPQVATPFMAKIEKTLDEMIAWNLDAHVMGGYEFLMQNYEAGDKICIFGFSRGAYTARALAGMVHKVGLLPACNHQQVPFAYKMFTRTDDLGWAQSTAFKKAFSIDVDIEFIGVWDTVCSVGLIPRRLPFTTSNTSVRTFRHAVSLDERRAKFKANLFNRPTEKEAQLGTHAGDMPKAGVDDTIDAIDTNLTTVQPQPDVVVPTATQKGKKQDGKPGKKSKAKNTQQELERQFSMQGAQLETDVLEVWFTGCHCDVGGGSVSNDTPHNLARIPLRWMIRQCFLTNTGIRFHSELLPNAGLDPASLYPVVLPRPPAIYTSPSVPSPSHTRDNTARTLVNYADATPSVLTEEEHDLADALCPIYDQLVIAPAWWILEILPIKHREQREDDTWHSALTVNLGHGRKIPKQKRQGFFVHRSVKIRMETEGLAGGPYTPRARFKVEPTWVD